MSQLVWRKSSFSSDDANRDCVELAAAPDGATVHLRESDDPTVVLTTSRAGLGALLRGIKAGDFDSLAR